MSDNDDKKLILALCAENGPPGHEEAVRAVIRERLEALSVAHSTDAMGNLFGLMPSKRPNAPTILLDAHMDEVAMTVAGVDNEGFLSVRNTFHMDVRGLLGCTVTVCGREQIPGVISCMPPHLAADDAGHAADPHKLCVDIGLPKECAERLVRPGDPVVYASQQRTLRNGGISAKALDNRAGCAALLLCLETMRSAELPYNLTLMFSSQEEAGLRGARTGGHARVPSEAVVVDVSFARTPDANAEITSKLGGGPMIGYAPILSRELSDRLRALCERNNLRFQLEIMTGNTGTNASVLHTAAEGAKTGIISIPMRYMHTPAEVVMLRDVQDTARLLSLYLLERKEAYGNA